MSKNKRSRWIIIKLLVTVLLFGLSWSYRPVDAAEGCPAGATLNAVCVTVSECGDQSCDAAAGGGGSTVGYCQKTYLGGECVHYGCSGGTCTPLGD